jgi:hypothetical protein
MRLLSAIKTAVVPDEPKPRTIRYGAFRGIQLDLSLKHRSQVYLGLYERETHAWLRKFSKGIKTGIDIGAAEGELTLFFLKLTNAEKVLAFEPSPVCLAVLRRNLELNGVDPRTTDRLSINQSLVGCSNSETTISLDSLVSSIQAPCFIKMDVDGAEEDILLGAKEFNRLPGVRWLIETHSEALEKSCLNLLTQAGFQTKVIKNAWWRIILPEVRPIAHNRWLAAWKTE